MILIWKIRSSWSKWRKWLTVRCSSSKPAQNGWDFLPPILANLGRNRHLFPTGHLLALETNLTEIWKLKLRFPDPSLWRAEPPTQAVSSGKVILGFLTSGQTGLQNNSESHFFSRSYVVSQASTAIRVRVFMVQIPEYINTKWYPRFSEVSIPQPSYAMKETPKHSPREEHCPSPKEEVLGKDGQRTNYMLFLVFFSFIPPEIICIGWSHKMEILFFQIE